MEGGRKGGRMELIYSVYIHLFKQSLVLLSCISIINTKATFLLTVLEKLVFKFTSGFT